MSDQNNTPEALAQLLAMMDESLDEELLDPERTCAESIDAQLEAAGFSPGEINARAERLAARATASSPAKAGPLAWQSRAREKLERSREILSRRAPSTPPSGQQNRVGLLRQLDGLRSVPGAEGRIQAYFRNKSPEEVSDEELLDLIQDLSMLHTLFDPID